MTIYFFGKSDVAKNQKISGTVITVAEGYRVSHMTMTGEKESGWDMYPHTYKTLLGLLRAVKRAGHFVSLD